MYSFKAELPNMGSRDTSGWSAAEISFGFILLFAVYECEYFLRNKSLECEQRNCKHLIK